MNLGTRQWTAALFVVSASVLASCGGGDNDETAVTSSSFELSSTTLTPPQAGTTSLSMTFGATYQTDPSKQQVTFSAYVIPSTAASTTASASNRVAELACFAGNALCPFRICTFSSTRALNCGGAPLTLAAGSYSVIGRACVKNLANNDICDEKRIALTVN
jgi:hypothetical protein